MSRGPDSLSGPHFLNVPVRQLVSLPVSQSGNAGFDSPQGHDWAERSALPTDSASAAARPHRRSSPRPTFLGPIAIDHHNCPKVANSGDRASDGATVSRRPKRVLSARRKPGKGGRHPQGYLRCCPLSGLLNSSCFHGPNGIDYRNYNGRNVATPGDRLSERKAVSPRRAKVSATADRVPTARRKAGKGVFDPSTLSVFFLHLRHRPEEGTQRYER